jgi:hypothetical protein
MTTTGRLPAGLAVRAFGIKQAITLAAVFVLAAFQSFAEAGEAGPPDGEYNCHKISGRSLIYIATLDIKGKTYRISKDDAFAPFTVDGNGTITWSAGISFMPEGWKLTSSTYKGLSKEGQPIILINYDSQSGFAEVMDCVKEK